jgi:GDP-mannose 6-dehydrogenase
MKITILGLGYVGFTSMCCLAHQGHDVVGIDVNETKVQAINSGAAPIVEPEVCALLQRALAAGRVAAFAHIDNHLDDSDVAIVCVGTPSAPDGSHDMSYIAKVTHQIAASVKRDRSAPLAVVFRSTVRPGTMEGLIVPIFAASLGKGYACVINPEFLRESSAVADYFGPSKIVIGTGDGRPSPRMEALYADLSAPRFYVRFGDAELTKLVDNAWHAVKIAFANEIGRLCLQLGLSAATAHEIFVSDTKLNISPYYLRPGGAFGGSCLPKDVRALQQLSADCGANTPLIDALLRSNEGHKFRLFQYATAGLQPGAAVLLAGIAFKDGTDDLRESPNVDLARALLRAGFELAIFDPTVDVSRLAGANLGYAWSQLPQLAKLLVSKADAETRRFDRVLATNKTVWQLALPKGQEVIDLSRLA